VKRRSYRTNDAIAVASAVTVPNREPATTTATK